MSGQAARRDPHPIGADPAPGRRPRLTAMRVALPSPCWPPDAFPSGIATYVGNLRPGLAALGVESRVLAMRADGPPRADVLDARAGDAHRSLGTRVIERAADRLSGELGNAVRLGRWVSRTLQRLERDWPVDLIEMEESFGAARIVKARSRTPLVVRLHGPWCFVGPALGRRRDLHFWLRCRAEALAIGAADGVSSPSRAALEVVRRSYGLPLPDAAVIPNPVAVAVAGEAWTLGGCDRDTILFVGRFDRVKGADTVLDAFGLLAPAFPRARLLFAGPDMGLFEGDRIWTFPQYLAARVPAQARARISFLGSLPRLEIERLRRQALVTVVASRFETFGMVALEAMAAGAPLVSSRAGGLAEIGTPGESCLAFASEDAGDLAAQLRALLEHPERAAGLGAAGMIEARQRFAPEVVAPQMAAFYRRVRAMRAVGAAGAAQVEG
jgi:glycosyltransferase involved in cell wall biosynthesis